MIRIPRISPLAEKYHWLSPYAYCAADPSEVTPSEVHLINFNEYNREVWPYGDFFLTLHSK